MVCHENGSFGSDDTVWGRTDMLISRLFVVSRLCVGWLFTLAVAFAGCTHQPVEPHPEPNALPDHILVRLHDEDPRIRHMAVTFLGGYPCRPTAIALTEALDDPVPMVRGVAASSWGEIATYWHPDPEIRAMVIDRLCAFLAEEDSAVRRGAAYALGRGTLRDRKAVPFLARALLHCDADTRNAAANSLGRIGDPSAIPALIACLKKYHKDESTAFSVSFSLDCFGLEATGPLEEAAKEAGPELSSIMHIIIRNIKNRS